MLPSRSLLIGVIVTLASSHIALAENVQFRNARENEIRQLLNGASDLRKASNGYEYRQGNKNGYKISNGQICVLFPNKQTDCVSIKTDGKVLQMIDNKGNRVKL
ncbi:hypothetical protein [Rhizobium sp. WYJ-E13]|uniref:hypothetical protein n=1 Tax=unclassified Rhizobium TaxID=2613769 RepID=UPI001C1E96D7|nr:hypothetical protein [Rhizobium sp. WYJ-E13]QWW69052.1 hypothetical protein KQ933_04905 [Rhizobium sp. WYJ-E13]